MAYHTESRDRHIRVPRHVACQAHSRAAACELLLDPAVLVADAVGPRPDRHPYVVPDQIDGPIRDAQMLQGFLELLRRAGVIGAAQFSVCAFIVHAMPRTTG